jgi:N-acetylglucosaminyldiphosphoundecaprenol N-acetyl-beta-D-mannosaminyltransferase
MLKEDRILDVKINTDLSWEDILSYTENNLLVDCKSHYICTTNSEFIVDAQADTHFKEIINAADLSLPDGVGVIFAYRFLTAIRNLNKNNPLYTLHVLATGLSVLVKSLLQDKVIQERRDGVTLVEKLCDIADKKKYSIFLLGGKDSVTNDNVGSVSGLAAANIRNKYPNIDIIGNSSQYNREETDDDKTISYIKQCMQENGIHRLDYLFVAYGHKYQEKWIVRNANKIPASLSVGVGATLDYISGVNKRAPSIYINNGLEWLFRIIDQPWRFKRIIKATVVFPTMVVLKALSRR